MLVNEGAKQHLHPKAMMIMRMAAVTITIDIPMVSRISRINGSASRTSLEENDNGQQALWIAPAADFTAPLRTGPRPHQRRCGIRPRAPVRPQRGRRPIAKHIARYGFHARYWRNPGQLHWDPAGGDCREW